MHKLSKRRLHVRAYISPVLLLGLLAGCAEADAGTPVVIGQAWSLRIGSMVDSRAETTTVDFTSIDQVDFADNRVGFSTDLPSFTAVSDPTGFLPPPPRSLEEARDRGLGFVAMTYCAFVNDTGTARSEDAEAVENAVSVFLSAIEPPYRDADLAEGSLARAGTLANERLLERLLEQLDTQGLQDSMNKVERSLRRRVEGEVYLGESDIERLAGTLSSLVWAFGDSSTRNTLRGCGSLLFFDVPEEVRANEFVWSAHLIPGNTCHGTNTGGNGALVCSLEAWHRRLPGDRYVTIRNPPDSAAFTSWRCHPELEFSPPWQPLSVR